MHMPYHGRKFLDGAVDEGARLYELCRRDALVQNLLRVVAHLCTGYRYAR